ncbi:MAG: hypothetical protein WDM76_03740 [Limisphaerales bacterium]
MTIRYAADPSSAGSDFFRRSDGQVVNGKVSATQSWGDYHDLKLGTLHINKAGKIIAIVKPVSKVGLGVMNLRFRDANTCGKVRFIKSRIFD